ncbi:hypothetical protein BH10PSE19_BH10PSE19_10970 [soil metagenome]
MQYINKWLSKKHKSQQHFVSIQEALLGKNILAYAMYRLRFFSLNSLIVLAIHLIEFTLLSFVFSRHSFISLVFLRAICLLVTGGWWGALEILRTRVRHFHRRRRKDFIRTEISCWLTLTALISSAIFIYASIYFVSSLFAIPVGTLDLFQAYQLVILLQVVFQLLVKTFHSGIYGLRRVARPFFSISITEFIVLLGTIALWPLWGAVSLPAALFVSSLAATGLSIFYTTRTYRLQGVFPLHIPSIKEFRIFLWSVPSVEFFCAMIAGMLMSVDGAVIFIMLLDLGQSAQNIGILLFLIAPLIRGGIEWAHLFYFDLKRLHLRLLTKFREKFERQLSHLSFVIGIPFWLLASTITLLYAGTSALPICMLLLPFFLLITIIAYAQLKLFTHARYLDVIVSSLFVIAPVAAIGLLELGLVLKLVVVTAGMSIAYFYSRRPCLPLVKSNPAPKVDRGLCAWLSKLRAEKTSVQLHAIFINYTETTKNIAIFMEHIATSFDMDCTLRRVGSSHQILAYQHLTNKNHLNKEWLLTNGAGMVEQWLPTPVYLNGQQAISAACKLPLLKYIIKSAWLEQPFVLDKKRLINEFRAQFPKGIVFDPVRKNKGPFATLELSVLRRVLIQAELFLMGIHNHHLQWSVSALYLNHHIRLIFVIPKASNDPNEIKRWLHKLEEYNLRGVVAAAKIKS